jgi:hypothetical protein
MNMTPTCLYKIYERNKSCVRFRNHRGVADGKIELSRQLLSWLLLSVSGR